jgi:predicted PurR-regulated permease PerM
MLLDKEIMLKGIKKFIYATLDKPKAKSLIDTLKESNAIFSGFIIGKLIDSLIIGVLCFIFTSILKLPYAMIISIVVGITNMIPYFGPFIGAVPGGLLLLMISPAYCVKFIILIFILQQFDGLILGPKILGNSTGLRPFWIIFAITVGGWVGGVLGMFLGVPFVAVIANLVDKFINKQLTKKNISI